MNKTTLNTVLFWKKRCIAIMDSLYGNRLNRAQLFVEVAGFIINFATQLKGILS